MHRTDGLTRRGALAGLGAAGAAALWQPHRAGAHDGHPHGGGSGDSPRRDAPPLSLTGARLLDPGTGTVTEDATIVFRRGVVWRAGADARPARSGRVIDVAGAFVLPGLIDAHVHVATVASARLALAGGATAVRSASTAAFQDIGVRALAEVGGLGVPRAFAAGVFVTPNLGDSILADPRLAPLATLADGVRSPEALRHVVEVNIARGVDLVKTRSTERAGLAEQDPRVQVYDERQIRAVVEAARPLRGGVACHGHGDEGIRDSVLAGVRSVEHGTFASAATLDLMRARGTYLVPTLSAVRDLAEPGGEYTDPRLVERGRQMLAVLRQTVPAAHARGIPIAAGTDTSYTAASLSTITGEIRLLAEFGLSEPRRAPVGHHGRRRAPAPRPGARPARAGLRRRCVRRRRRPPGRPRGARRRAARRRRRLDRARGRHDRAAGHRLVDKALLEPPDRQPPHHDREQHERGEMPDVRPALEPEGRVADELDR